MANEQAITMTEKRLADLESRIRRGLESFVEVGNALAEIKARNGFMLRGAKTFDEYCSKTFGFSERNGYRMIAAAETAKKVEDAVGEKPRNEAAARELKAVAHDPDLIKRVNDRLQKSKLTVATATAEKIHEIVEKIRPQSKPMFEEKPEKKPALPQLSDTCPICHQQPQNYIRREDGWHCGIAACNAPVMVGVIPMNAQACPECGAALLTPGAEFCETCGCVLEGS
jgi:hypothetical protein